MPDVSAVRHIAPLRLDRDEDAAALDDPVDLGTVGIAPEPDTRLRAADPRRPDELEPHELFEELSETLPRQSPPFARGESPNTHVEEEMPARSGELGAGAAARQGIDALGDEAVLEDLVIAGDGGVADTEVLRECAEAHDPPGFERGQLEEARERTDVTDERLRPDLVLEIPLHVSGEVALPIGGIRDATDSRKGAVQQPQIEWKLRLLGDAERVEPEQDETAGQEVDGRSAAEPPRGRSGKRKLRDTGVDRVLHDIEDGRNALNLVQHDERAPLPALPRDGGDLAEKLSGGPLVTEAHFGDVERDAKIERESGQQRGLARLPRAEEEHALAAAELPPERGLDGSRYVVGSIFAENGALTNQVFSAGFAAFSDSRANNPPAPITRPGRATA